MPGINRAVNKTICLLVGGLLVALICAAALRHPQRNKIVQEEVVRFDRKIIDIGDVIAGAQREVVFHFVNAGQSAVKIVGVQSTCSCKGEIAYPDDDIAPGEGADISVKMIPTVERSRILFYANITGGTECSIPLEIHCRAYRDAFLEPSALVFSQVIVGEGASEETTVFASPDAIIWEAISQTTSPATWINVEIKKATGIIKEVAGEGEETARETRNQDRVAVATIGVTITPDAPIGVFSKTVTLKVEDSNGSRNLFLNCTGEVCEIVRAVPSRLVLLGGDYEDYAQVTIKSIEGSFQVLSLRSDVVECSLVQPSEGNDEARIRVSLPKQVKKTDGSIWVEIDHPSVQNVVVPVKIVGIDADLPGSQDERPGGLR